MRADKLRVLALGLLPCAALSGCNGGATGPELTLAGKYSGTTSSSCQGALRDSQGNLVEAHGLSSNFRQKYAVAPGKGRYYLEVRCPDGKMANTPPFDFEPPRASIELQDIGLN